ncbi:MAG TPA: hypothetical protein VGY49_11565 [Burkholderiaceae bacterium]|jgi:hypothetical protein|nr:hypothetical protein [Burkholderiaceae bacterium]
MNLGQWDSESRRFSALFFAAVSCVLFLPFFGGKFVVAGTDVLFAHYPNLLYGYREFEQFGAFSLWNRYIFCGMDFTASMHAHFLNPLYWPLLLFPERYVFHVVTGEFLVANALIGWIWSRIALRLGAPGAGSLIVGVVAQAGMFFWFAMTTMIAVPMYLAASIAIHVILTHESRGRLTNYLGLSLSLGMLFITPHPTYILGFFLPVLALFLVKAYPGWFSRPWQGPTPEFGAACVTAVLLCAYRLVPVALELTGHGSLHEHVWLPEFLNHAYFGLTSFNPLALGIRLDEAASISEALHVGATRHTQAHNGLYFGLLPLLIVYAAVRAGGSRRVAVLGFAYATFQLAYLFAFQPLSDIVDLVLHPLGHEGIYRPASAILFQLLLIDGAKVFPGISTETIRKVVRECIVISGLLIAAWCVMYAKVLHGVPWILDQVGVATFVNSFRLVVVAVVVFAAAVSALPDETIARLRFAVTGVLVGALVLLLADTAAVANGLWPGPEATGTVFKSGIFVVLACLAIPLSGLARSKQVRRLGVLFAALAGVLLLVRVRNSPVGGDFAVSAWAGASGWAMYVAILSVSLSLFARSARGDLGRETALKWMLLLTVVDLAVAYRDYSYVNMPSTPFFRQMKDVYPQQTLMTRFLRDKTTSGEQQHLRNLLANAELKSVSGRLIDWSFGGGTEMKTCPQQPSNPLPGGVGSEVSLCYPRDDAAGNLYQDVPVGDDVGSVAFGVWVFADQGMEMALFLTAPSLRVGGPVARHRGDGRWHWIYATLGNTEAMQAVRCHVNMTRAGRIDVYAPQLVADAEARPALRPADGRPIAEEDEHWPEVIDLESFRVNHVHIINRYGNQELMTNIAMIDRTPTYSGVDSDLAADYTKLLQAFKAPDPSWYHRAGLLSTLDDKRLLDLLGVGYDIGADGRVIVRPDAISRLAAFSGFEVQSDPDRALQRLKDADFDPTKAVVLQSEPLALHWSASSGQRFRQLRYETTAADTLNVRVSENDSRLVLFNDRFSSGWKAHWNGAPLQVIRANFAFMAVALPEGPGELTFEFRPEPFLTLAKLSAITAAALSLLAGILLLRFWRARRDRGLAH